jgi:hypothetical protein
VTVAELLRDTVAVGVLHLSPAIQERLTTAPTGDRSTWHLRTCILQQLFDHLAGWAQE